SAASQTIPLSRHLYCLHHLTGNITQNLRIVIAGIRTNGRVEVENRINKVFGGPKKTLLQLFNSLNERTNGQTIQEMVESSHHQHVQNLEILFAGPLAQLRQHAGPFALQKCYKEMEESLFYETEVVQRPLGVKTWVCALELSALNH
ncbi:hypothetical protein EV424DRAFT_1327688, partial [Suillus variegatus]